VAGAEDNLVGRSGRSVGGFDGGRAEQRGQGDRQQRMASKHGSAPFMADWVRAGRPGPHTLSSTDLSLVPRQSQLNTRQIISPRSAKRYKPHLQRTLLIKLKTLTMEETAMNVSIIPARFAYLRGRSPLGPVPGILDEVGTKKSAAAPQDAGKAWLPVDPGCLSYTNLAVAKIAARK
jgi:hypothetical protein